MQPISAQWFYILWRWWIHVSVLAVFWWTLLGFPCRVSCHLWKVKFWLPLCQFGCLLFCYLITEAKTGESGHPCHVPDLGGKALSFPPLRIILVVGLSYMDFKMLRYVPSILIFLRVFIKKGCCILSSRFSASIDRIIWFLSFLLLTWYIILIDLWILN